MKSGNHEIITQTALYKKLQQRAIQFVMAANVGSDWYKQMNWIEQHFCNSGTTADSVRKSREFIQRALDMARGYVHQGDTDDTKTMDLCFYRALYYVGRALHCAQDFYAHSNWIMLNYTRKWHGEMPPDLMLCKPSKYVTDNNPLYQPRKLSFLAFYSKRESFDRITCQAPETRAGQALYHPEMQFDGGNSWAGKVFADVYGGGDDAGYMRAEALARLHTSSLWDEFTADIDPGSLRALEIWEPAAVSKITTFYWAGLRNQFWNDMHSNAPPAPALPDDWVSAH